MFERDARITNLSAKAGKLALRCRKLISLYPLHAAGENARLSSDNASGVSRTHEADAKKPRMYQTVT